MIRENRFVFSKGQYAVAPETFDFQLSETGTCGRFSIQAVWYRGTKAAPKACIGYLWTYDTIWLSDWRSFLSNAFHDGRYGGHSLGRWDGTSYFAHGGSVPEVQDAHMAILGPMLENMPVIPASYDGWWRFPTSKELAKMRLAH